MALTKEQIIDEIKQMSVIQLSEIVKALEEEFGVSAAAAVAAAPAAGAAAGDAAGGAAEEKDEFTVNITSAGDNKIAAIKAVREVTDLGLKEAKALVESAPSAVKEGVSKEEADKIKTALEGAGLKVELA